MFAELTAQEVEVEVSQAKRCRKPCYYSDASKVLVAKPERQNVPRNLSILMPTHNAATSSVRYRNLRKYA